MEPASSARPSVIALSESCWPLSPAHPELYADEIHVWCAGLDPLAADLPSFARTLSAGERNRAERFQLDLDRTRFIVRRGLLRKILGRYLDIDPARLSFIYESRGKPALAEIAEGKTPRFNLSHSDGLALFALTPQPDIGIDVERLRPIPESSQIAAKFFSPHENAMLNALPAEQTLEAFFNCWTRKEAYLKATGEGIADALPQIEVTLAPGQAAQLLNIAGNARAAAPWSLHSLLPAPGFIGALAAKAQGQHLLCWRWQESPAAELP